MASEVLFGEFGPFNGIFPLNQENWAKVFGPVFPDGILADAANEMEVYANSSGMKVFVKTGECRIRGHRGEITTETSLDIAAADATNPRIDLIVARVEYDSGTGSTLKLAVLTGTPAAAPAAPAVTQTAGVLWEMALAEVRVDAGAVTIAAGKIIDRRTFMTFGGSADPMEIFYFGGA